MPVCGTQFYIQLLGYIFATQVNVNNSTSTTRRDSNCAPHPCMVLMECFATPNGASLSEVPYLGSNSYDSGPFLTFPQRVGFDAQVLRLGQPEIVFEEDEFATLQGFLQDWLFFGLLHI